MALNSAANRLSSLLGAIVILLAFSPAAEAAFPFLNRPATKSAQSRVQQVAYEGEQDSAAAPVLGYDSGEIRYLDKPFCCPPKRHCAPPVFSPRGRCGSNQTGCQRLDYARYVVRGRKRNDYKETRIQAALHPEYEGHNLNFWVMDTGFRLHESDVWLHPSDLLSQDKYVR